MRDTSLMQLALGLAPPWTVTRSAFDQAAQRLDIHIDFAPGSRFACPGCAAANCPVHDTEQKTWRHFNFFQHQAFLHARVPRVRCGTCEVRQIAVPWARPGAGFTLLSEALLMALLATMPVNAVAKLVGEHDTRLWRIIRHYVNQARARTDLAALRRVAVDETASRRGHNYITLFVDIDRARTVFATEGAEPSPPSPARNPLHLAAQPGKSLRAPTRPLDALPTKHLKTARAYQMRLSFQDFYHEASADAGEAFLKLWYFWATHSMLAPMIEATHTIKRHWNGILRWFHSGIANGLMEGINSLVQAAEAKARGYRSNRNLIAMVYLITGKLDLQLPN